MPIQSDPDGSLVGAVAFATAPNYLRVVVDLSQAAWNTVGQHVLATITGVVRCRFWYYVIDQPTSANELAELSHIVADVALAGFITVGDDIPAGSLYVNTDVYNRSGNTSEIIFDKIVANGNIVVEVRTEPLTSGSLQFNLVWEPMTPGATA